MNLKKLKEIGRNDTIITCNNYGISYNSMFDYMCIYIIEETDKEFEGYYIEEFLFEGEKIVELFGHNFFDNSDITKLRKVKNYINNYVY